MKVAPGNGNASQPRPIITRRAEVAVATEIAGRRCEPGARETREGQSKSGTSLSPASLAKFALALVTGLMAFSQKNTPPEAIVKSRVAPYVTGAADVVAAMAPHELKEGFRKTYAQVKAAWEEAVQRGDRKQHERKI